MVRKLRLISIAVVPSYHDQWCHAAIIDIDAGGSKAVRAMLAWFNSRYDLRELLERMDVEVSRPGRCAVRFTTIALRPWRCGRLPALAPSCG